MTKKNKGGRPRHGVPYKKGDTWFVRDRNGLRTLHGAISREDALRVLASVGDRQTEIATPIVSSAPGVTEANGEINNGKSEAIANPLAGWLGTPAPNPGTGAPSAGPPVSDSSPTPKPNTMQLSDSDRAQMHGMLSQIVGQLNVAAIGFTVKVFGRQPEMPTDADLELLNKAWQMQLNIWFADTNISPMVCILAASVGLGFSMWAGGEPLPPKPKKGHNAGLQSVPGGLSQNPSPSS